MRLIIVLLLAFFSSMSYAQTVTIPDENFEKALIELGIDTDGEINGQILKSDALKVNSLDISNKNINDLTGIEEFTALQYLDCKDNKLSYSDFSQNISLVKMLYTTNDIGTHNSNIRFLDWFDKW